MLQVSYCGEPVGDRDAPGGQRSRPVARRGFGSVRAPGMIAPGFRPGRKHSRRKPSRRRLAVVVGERDPAVGRRGAPSRLLRPAGRPERPLVPDCLQRQLRPRRCSPRPARSRSPRPSRYRRRSPRTRSRASGLLAQRAPRASRAARGARTWRRPTETSGEGTARMLLIGRRPAARGASGSRAGRPTLERTGFGGGKQLGDGSLATPP